MSETEKARKCLESVHWYGGGERSGGLDEGDDEQGMHRLHGTMTSTGYCYCCGSGGERGSRGLSPRTTWLYSDMRVPVDGCFGTCAVAVQNELQNSSLLWLPKILKFKLVKM
jgi:hypothetical protein